MPQKMTERKDKSRIHYEQIITNMINDCNRELQQGNVIQAYQTLRTIYTQLYEKHREWWLGKVQENFENGARVRGGKAERMLDPKRPSDHYLKPNLNHKRWLEIKKAFSDMCKEKSLFFHSREVEVGYE